MLVLLLSEVLIGVNQNVCRDFYKFLFINNNFMNQYTLILFACYYIFDLRTINC
jgi:hypothetical protein